MVLLIGYGTPGRGDDGLGPALATRMRARRLPRVAVQIDYQLKVEHAMELSKCNIVLFADAQVDAPGPFSFGQAQADCCADVTSHHLTPGALVILADVLFAARPHAFTLGIAGVAFDRIKRG